MKPSPEQQANAASKLVLEWMTSFMALASKRPLLEEDLYAIDPEFAAHRLGELVAIRLKAVRDRWSAHHSGGSSSTEELARDIKAELLSSFFQLFKTNWIFGAIWALFGVSFTIASPMVLQQVLVQVADGNKNIGVAMRTIMYSVVFRKSLRLSSAGYGIHSAWLIPLQVIIMSGLIINLLGIGGAIGIGVLVVLTASQTFAMKLIYKYDAQAMKFSDARVRKTTEMISCMKIIKLFAWEDFFIASIQKERAEELRNLFIEIVVAAGYYGFIYVIPTAVCIISFSIYAAAGNPLTADIIFPALSLIGLLRGPMMELPEKVQALVEANVALTRFAHFLACPEFLDEPKRIESENNNAIICENVSFLWEDWSKNYKEDVSTPFLKNITFQIPKGSLCAIVGPVGSGKSSLGGRFIFVYGGVGYASQQGWLQNSTLQANILFGAAMDRQRYEAVIHACSLDKDIQNFPNGELTEVGERGVQLSGGQVARVNLARTIYSNADILLLDDPLAAVDAHVGRHIFEVGIRQQCAGKTVILVTHQLNLLSQVDMIIFMESGQVLEIGSYHELMQQNLGLSKLVNEFNQKATIKTRNVKAMLNLEDATVVPKTVMMEEERLFGAVTLYHYKTYINLAGGYGIWFWIILINVAINVARVLNDYWLVWWSIDNFGFSNSTYIGVYAALGLIQAVLTMITAFFLAFAGISGARSFHTNALTSVSRAPMSFFDTNPLGRIINRFSRDVAECDRWLVINLRALANLGTGILCMLGLITYAVPTVLIVVVIVAPLYYFSPFFANCAETFNGLSVIRAFNVQDHFIAENEKLTDAANRPTSWVEAFVAVICLTVSTMGVATEISPLLLGLSIGYTLNLVFTINQIMHVISLAEGRMNSVERLDHYSRNIKSEGTVDLPLPRESWPDTGSISFCNAEMRYRPDLPPVLSNLTLEIKGGEKIGIVGRTGAGKSSIISALYRLVELSDGTISIDGVDLKTLGLRQLRTSLSIIPQAPILFQGSIRSNVDPLNLHDDGTIWKVLEHASLSEFVASLNDKLDAPVHENGENLSVGQRQLLCLARAMLLRPKILLIDEATASVDIKTDAAIQKALRSSFSGSTILCVAHRLLTIIDYDRVLVLKDGQVSEFDTPDTLLKNPDSLFSDLVNETGPEMAAYLKRLAGRRFGELEIVEDTIHNRSTFT
ncbi:P-loop containing nucleoside triphosphate hydrolase protein [Rhizoclosmatium globosum]|uniref:p-loop containing nucleoside triphosphate hydrolase protein n=1 Tax=Rhizoclosmatium globosum TaxID=329046 RepID=A0A1Y2C4E5_9FUNG|nr:P-loop containing nucleoside triphosphate hydrolase protein [Rhizoclosmatium globosum]|eukprot:ORY41910.1 P-loop containing nucleoside triphosphate hydrolase protein [Rhizoclosmatium globosum]